LQQLVDSGSPLRCRRNATSSKGSHAGSRRTTLKDRRKEIGAGLLRAILRQLGLGPRDLE